MNKSDIVFCVSGVMFIVGMLLSGCLLLDNIYHQSTWNNEVVLVLGYILVGVGAGLMFIFGTNPDCKFLLLHKKKEVNK